MKAIYNIDDIRNLLFVFDIENVDDEEREALIASKNVNDERELIELFDVLLKPDFLAYTGRERELFISTIDFFLSKDDSFDRVFENMTTYFDDDVANQKEFMEVLLSCLTRYHPCQKE